jgi:flagellar hook protein FlgE
MAKEGNQTFFTRAGNLTFDSNGYLVNPNGDRIQGFNALIQYNHIVINSAFNGGFAQVTEAELNLNSGNLASTQDIQISRDLTIPPKATTEVDFKGNLDSFQQPNVVDLFPGVLLGANDPTLPIGLAIAANAPPLNNAIDTNRMTIAFNATGGFSLQQVANLSTFVRGSTRLQLR